MCALLAQNAQSHTAMPSEGGMGSNPTKAIGHNFMAATRSLSEHRTALKDEAPSVLWIAPQG